MADTQQTNNPDATSGPAPDPVTERALAAIESQMPGAIIASETTGAHPWIQVGADALRQVCRLLKDDPETQLDCCHLISGVDWPEANEGAGELEAVYHLVSYSLKPDAAYRVRPVKNDPFVVIKVRVPRERPEVPTVMDIWTGADWHERETWDLMGIRFTNHPNHRRILCPEDWVGHPLRKDYEMPLEYHGIRGR
jgi:NADH-quinone oxidoreductase subunit C